MSTDPLHDDKLLAELAAFDELLRKPLEPEPSPAPPVRSAPPAPKPDARLRKPAAPPRPPLPPLVSSSPPSALSPLESLPIDEWLTEPEDLERPSAAAEAARAAALFPAPRRSRAGVLSIAALTAGIVIGGPLGWWLTAHLLVSTPPAELVELEPSATVPAATRPASSREAARRSASRTAAAASLPDAGRNVVRKNVAAPDVARPNVAAPNFAVPGATVSGAAMSSIPSAPAPSLDLPATVAAPAAAPAAAPLPSAPLRVGASTPSSPLAVAAAGAVAAVEAADQAAIERTLRQYKDAYERLDAKAASAVWPTVDQRALTRAFAGLASQSLDFRGCEVLVRAGASTATASCSGMAAYVRKVGDTRVRLEPRQWTFTLNKTQGAWRIEAVDGSR